MTMRGILCALSVAATPVMLAAQGANVAVTVTPAYRAGQVPPPRDGFRVCVGIASDRDKYGMQITPPTGVANTAFRNLPVNTQALVTISKPGFVGIERTISLKLGWNNDVYVNPAAGSGGPACPAPTTSTVSVSGTPIYVVPPPPPTATPGVNPTFQAVSQWMPARGNVTASDPVYDCTQFAGYYKLVGIRGKSGEAINGMSLICAYRDNSSVDDRKSTSNVGGTSGTDFSHMCSYSRYVYAISGTTRYGQIRSLTLHCKTEPPYALTTNTLSTVGQAGVATFGPDQCPTGLRGAALRIRTQPLKTSSIDTNPTGPMIISGVQLLCRAPLADEPSG